MRPICAFLFSAVCVPAIVGQDVTERRIPFRQSTVDPASRELRSARGRLFNLDGLPPLSAEKPGTPPRVTRQEQFPSPELPLLQSDVVVIASVLTADSYLLPGEGGIYTEYRAAASRIVYNRSKWSGAAVVDVLHLGGAIETATGTVMRHLLVGQGAQIETGRHYVMFLKYVADANCFLFVKVWQIEGGVMRANSDDDLERVRLGKSQVEGKSVDSVLASLFQK